MIDETVAHLLLETLIQYISIRFADHPLEIDERRQIAGLFVRFLFWIFQRTQTESIEHINE